MTKKLNESKTMIYLIIILAYLLFPLLNLLYAKSRVKPSQTNISESHCFFDFEQAQYHTSQDQRIGVKILIDPVKVGPTLASLQHLTFLPGAHIKAHRHVYVTEIIYVLKGNLTIRIGNITKVIGPDTVAYIPPQTFHEYKNETTDVCQFLQYFSPSGPEEEYRLWERVGDTKINSNPSPTSNNRNNKSKEKITKSLPIIPGSPITKTQQIYNFSQLSEIKSNLNIPNESNKIQQRQNINSHETESNSITPLPTSSKDYKLERFTEPKQNIPPLKFKTKFNLSAY